MDYKLTLGHCNALLDAAQHQNAFYYHFNLFGWVGVHRTHDFIEQVNSITNRLILDRVRDGRKEPINPLEALLVFQLNMECKAFYASMRNFVSPLVGRHVRPEPWDRARGELPSKRPSTSAIVRNLLEDLRAAAHGELADEMEATHLGLAVTIRNALAHATFLLPDSKTRDRYVFSTYKTNTAGLMTVEDTEVGQGEFTEYVKRFLNFRLAYFAAYTAHRDALVGKSFDFDAENQLYPGKPIRCRFDDGAITIPQWDGKPWW